MYIHRFVQVGREQPNAARFRFGQPKLSLLIIQYNEFAIRPRRSVPIISFPDNLCRPVLLNQHYPEFVVDHGHLAGVFDPGFMSDPFFEGREPLFRIGPRIERAVRGTVTIHQPGPLGRVATGFPHVENHWISWTVLNMCDSKTLRDYRPIFAGLGIHQADFPIRLIPLFAQRNPLTVAA